MSAATPPPGRAAVIGAGILGTLTALHLVRLGLTCHVLEQRKGTWEGATFAGEGKIHLGYVYGLADDETLAGLLLAAADFSADLELAVGRRLPWAEMVSTPFDYGIPSSSLISTDEFEAHAHRIRRLAEHHLGTRPFDYLGTSLDTVSLEVAPASESNRFLTPERSVDMAALRDIIRHCVAADPRIMVRPSTRVTNVAPDGDRWLLSTRSTADGEENVVACDIVVNCSWENSAHLDRMAGLAGVREPNLRLRKFVHAVADFPPTALTLTLGPFGDFVSFADGRAYASWYPTGLGGFRTSMSPPEDWSTTTDGSHDPDYLSSLIGALGEWVPGIAGIREPSVHSRIVVASGTTDIDDPRSGLHRRQGPHVVAKDGWISARSSKLTTAPKVARLVANAVTEMLA